jgi:hypothetical protein
MDRRHDAWIDLLQEFSAVGEVLTPEQTIDAEPIYERREALVTQVTHIDGYSLFILTRAVAMVNYQFVLTEAGRQALNLQRRC